MGPFYNSIRACTSAAMTSKALPRVPETLLKKRKEFQANKAKNAQAAIVQRKANKEKRKLIFKRAEQYIKEYRQKERDGIRLNRVAKKHGNYYVPDQPRCLCQVEQSYSSDAQNGRTNDHMGLS